MTLCPLCFTWSRDTKALASSLIHAVQQELDRAFPNPADICDEQKFMKADLTYLTRVINETMRINPVVAGGVVRDISEDIEHEGMLLPKGSTVMLHFYTLFRSHISQPDEFLPDRWDETHPEYALLKSLYMPFSLGKRNCIGMNLAALEIRYHDTHAPYDCTQPFSLCPLNMYVFTSSHSLSLSVSFSYPTELSCPQYVDLLHFRYETKTIL